MPCFLNDDLELSFDCEKFELETKPHGTGEINLILGNPEILAQLRSLHCRWLYFMNDTNPLAITNLPAYLGYNMKHKFKASLAGVKRLSGETTGLIMENQEGRIQLIDYHDWNKMSSQKANKEPERIKRIAALEKDSIGTINNLLIDFDLYAKFVEVAKSAEFVNVKRCPKSSKILSSFRSESWYLDILKIIDCRIGFPVFPREVCFTTCKNKLSTGRKNQARGLNTETLISCENDIFYKNNLMICNVLGRDMPKDVSAVEKHSIFVKDVPEIWLGASTGMYMSDLEQIIDRDGENFYESKRLNYL